MAHLLHPDIFPTIPLVGTGIERNLNHRIVAVETSTAPAIADITVAVRTLNEADTLETLLKDIKQQDYEGEIEIVIVDNESVDHTKQIAKDYGADVVTIGRDSFTHPRSLNMCMEAASHDLVLLTVGHAALSSSVSLKAGASHFSKANTGAVGFLPQVLPGDQASKIEKLAGIVALPFTLSDQRVNKFKIANLGFGAVGAIFSKTAWDYLDRFDEDYEAGGEDTAMARKMVSHGLEVIHEPLLAVHHSHGIGLFNFALQSLAYRAIGRGPKQLDIERYAARRPDLNFAKG